MTQHSSAVLWSTGLITATATCVATALVCANWAGKPALKAPSKAPSKASSAAPTAYSEELIREQLARNYAFLGEEGMEKVRQQRVVVVGAGGVGLAVATLLVRLGVGHLRVIDFDQVSLLSLNRHAVATVRDVGTSKVECLRAHLNTIAPWVAIDAVNCLWTIDCAQRLIIDGFEPTYVVDCIDNIDTKVDLLHYCHQNKIPVISLGGAACKLDPTRINVADISLTEEDPLCRQVRVRLKKRGVTSGINMVFSAEKPDPRKAQLLPLSNEQLEEGDVGELAALRDFRVRILPVLGTVPGMFGLSIATYLVSSVAGYPIEYVEGKNRYTSYESIYQSLAGQQLRIGETDQRVPILVADVAYIVQEVFRGKSVISDFLLRLTLLRWDPAQELSFQNIVVLTKEEQKQHESRVLNGKEDLTAVYLPQILEKVAARFSQERYYSLWNTSLTVAIGWGVVGRQVVGRQVVDETVIFNDPTEFESESDRIFLHPNGGDPNNCAHPMFRQSFSRQFVGLIRTPVRSELKTLSRSYTSNAVKPKKPTGLKALMKEYGYSALGVYFALSMVDLPLCYILVHSLGKDEIERYENDAKRYFGYGVDPAELEQRQQIRKITSEIEGETSHEGWLAQFSWTEFALAYGIHKSLIFVRVPICAAITPGVVSLLRRWGFRIGSANLSANALIAKDKIQDMTASSAQFGVRPNAKKRWFSWFF